MKQFITTMNGSIEFIDNVISAIVKQNTGYKTLRLWYHTKINRHAIETGEKPDDGTLADVMHIDYNVSEIPDNRKHNKIDLHIAVKWFAKDPAENFIVMPLLECNEDGLALVGFSVFPK